VVSTCTCEVESTSATPTLVPFDRVRTIGAPSYVITLSCERVQKLLSNWHTGLPTGLRERDDLSEDALSIFGHGAAALAAEARLLAQPVSFELPTSSIAESIEDRVTMASLAARRLDEQANLALRLATVELLCAAQAIDLRGRSAALGAGTHALYTLVRSHIPPLRAGDSPVTDLDALLTAFEASLAGTPDELTYQTTRNAVD